MNEQDRWEGSFSALSKDSRWSSASKKVLRRSILIAQNLGKEVVTVEDILASLLDIAPTSRRLLYALSANANFNTEEKLISVRRNIGGLPAEAEPGEGIGITTLAYEVLHQTLVGRLRRVEPVSIYRHLVLHAPETLAKVIAQNTKNLE